MHKVPSEVSSAILSKPHKLKAVDNDHLNQPSLCMLALLVTHVPHSSGVHTESHSGCSQSWGSSRFSVATCKLQYSTSTYLMAAFFHIPSKTVLMNHLTISSYKVTDTLPELPDHEDEELQSYKSYWTTCYIPKHHIPKDLMFTYISINHFCNTWENH